MREDGEPIDLPFVVAWVLLLVVCLLLSSCQWMATAALWRPFQTYRAPPAVEPKAEPLEGKRAAPRFRHE